MKRKSCFIFEKPGAKKTRQVRQLPNNKQRYEGWLCPENARVVLKMIETNSVSLVLRHPSVEIERSLPIAKVCFPKAEEIEFATVDYGSCGQLGQLEAGLKTTFRELSVLRDPEMLVETAKLSEDGRRNT